MWVVQNGRAYARENQGEGVRAGCEVSADVPLVRFLPEAFFVTQRSRRGTDYAF